MKEKRKSSIWEILIVGGLGVAITFYVYVLPTWSNQGRKSPETAVLTNLKQISTGLHIYAHQTNGTLPEIQADQTKLQQLLTDSVKLNPETFTFGVDDHQVKIQLNPNLSNLQIEDIAEPEKVIAAYTPYAKNRFSSVDKYWVVYMDGSYKKIPAEDWPTKNQSLTPNTPVTAKFITANRQPETPGQTGAY